MNENKQTAVTSSSMLVYGDQTQVTSVKLNTQNCLLWMNGIYTVLESREKVGIIEKDPTAKIDKS